MPKLKWCGVLAGALLLTQITVGAVVAQTSAPVVVWQRYDVDISVQSDGSLEIAQIQTISFRGTLQHGFRVVPLERTTGITSVTVAERVDGREQPYATGSNRPFTFTTSREQPTDSASTGGSRPPRTLRAPLSCATQPRTRFGSTAAATRGTGSPSMPTVRDPFRQAASR